MTRYWPLSTLTFPLILAGALSGCATYGKCESDRCQGDAKITSEVQALFRENPPLEPPNLLSVHTTNRIVYLYGLVATDLQRDMAESVALQAPDIAMVVNGIAVTER
jgi:osmotically-inducible protein OsmY